MREAVSKKHILYNICFRRAGVAIMWSDEARQKSPKDWNSALYIETYYPSIQDAVDGELKRIREMKETS
jgi:hypothetical protein